MSTKPHPSGTRKTRRSFLQGAAAAGAAVMAPELFCAAARAAAAARPNLIFFLGEGARWDESSLAGNPVLKTPNIDRIGREGVVFILAAARVVAAVLPVGERACHRVHIAVLVVRVGRQPGGVVIAAGRVHGGGEHQGERRGGGACGVGTLHGGFLSLQGCGWRGRFQCAACGRDFHRRAAVWLLLGSTRIHTVRGSVLRSGGQNMIS